MRTVIATSAEEKIKEVNLVRRSSRAKSMVQRQDSDSSLEAKGYDFKARSMKNLVNDLMYPLMDFQVKLDLELKENQKWLDLLGLEEYANFPWANHLQNIFSPKQVGLLQVAEAITGKEQEFTLAFFSKIFNLPNEGEIDWEKSIDEEMCREFGIPEG